METYFVTCAGYLSTLPFCRVDKPVARCGTLSSQSVRINAPHEGKTQHLPFNRCINTIYDQDQCPCRATGLCHRVNVSVKPWFWRICTYIANTFFPNLTQGHGAFGEKVQYLPIVQSFIFSVLVFTYSHSHISLSLTFDTNLYFESTEQPVLYLIITVGIEVLLVLT